MLILTAHNSSHAEIGSLCVQSIARYCRAHPEARFIAHLIPDNYPRKASWYKIELIKRHLPDHDYVLWIDADALIVGSDDLASILKPATLNISSDNNGINHGVVAWKNCEESFRAFDRIESLYPQFTEHIWFEQAALMTFVDELNVFYQPKEVFNAYQHDLCAKTQILHFPGMKTEERLPLMKGALAA